MTELHIGSVHVGNALPLSIIAGPCQLESLEHARLIAGTLAEICSDLGLGLIFKGSYDKANRSSLAGQRGLGMDRGLDILAAIRDEFGCPVLSDVHAHEHCARAAKHVDVLQIPAFLCRQTDLLVAAAATGCAINIKKGQFLAPWDMAHVAQKVTGSGNNRVMLCERGTTFGYNMLVSDMRALPIMAQTGFPVIFDATHSVQLPGGQGASSGGQRQFVAPLARAAVAVGCAGIFIETHQAPDTAPSDGPNMVPLDQMAPLLRQLRAIDRVTKAGQDLQ
jgi:2-dehydro-3-deoxyphosphooctonate aldolase (KDO 8-P synthase)